MFNLLPENHKAGNKREYRRRRLTIYMAVSLFLIVVFDAFLSATYYFLYIKREENKAELANRKGKFESEEYDKIVADMNILNEQVVFLNAKSMPLFVNNVVDFIVDRSGSGVKVEGISFGGIQTAQIRDTKNSKTEVIRFWEINVRGVARSRDTLRAFLTVLEQNPSVDKVETPVSNFTQREDLEFAIKLTGNI